MCRPDSRRDVSCEFSARVCGSSWLSFSGTGGSIMSETLSSLLDAGFKSRSPHAPAPESWDSLAQTPEQLRWVMNLPSATRLRDMGIAERQIRAVGAREHP